MIIFVWVIETFLETIVMIVGHISLLHLTFVFVQLSIKCTWTLNIPHISRLNKWLYQMPVHISTTKELVIYPVLYWYISGYKTVTFWLDKQYVTSFNPLWKSQISLATTYIFIQCLTTMHIFIDICHIYMK